MHPDSLAQTAMPAQGTSYISVADTGSKGAVDNERHLGRACVRSTGASCLDSMTLWMSSKSCAVTRTSASDWPCKPAQPESIECGGPQPLGRTDSRVS